jgi:hypothetical protein
MNEELESNPYRIQNQKEDELIPSITNLSQYFGKYRKSLGDYITRLTREDPEIFKGLNDKGAAHEKKLLFGKFAKQFESPLNLEEFYRTAMATATRHLSSPTSFLVDQEEKSKDWLEGHLQSGKEDKVREMVVAVNQYLRREIERLSLNLLELYRRKEQTYYMKEKKQEDLRRLMRNDRFVKMNLERQVEQLERTRRGLIEALVYLNLSEETLQETNSEGFLSDLLTKYLDKKDFVIGMLEDKLLDLLINEVVSHYKQSQIISFNSYCQCLANLLYFKKFSFSVDKYLTNCFVKGSFYISNKKSSSFIRDPNLISLNLMEQVCDFSGKNPHSLTKYASNYMFDNLTISRDSIDGIYHSFAFNHSKTVLIIKNLMEAFLDEVDNTEHLTYENPFDSMIHFLSTVKDKVTKDLFSDVFGDDMKSVITNHMVHIKKTVFVNAACIKYATSEDELKRSHDYLKNRLQEVFEKQNQMLQFHDYFDFERMIVFNDTRFKLKEKNNPNQRFLDAINGLRGIDVLKIKNIPSMLLVSENLQVMKNDCRLKDVIIHKEAEVIFEGLMMNSYEFFQEKLDMYIAKKSKEINDRFKSESEDNPETFDELSKGLSESIFGLVHLLSRNSVIRLISYQNYYSSVEIEMCRQDQLKEELTKNYENIEALKFTPEESHLLAMRQLQKEKSSFHDDSRLESSNVRDRLP